MLAPYVSTLRAGRSRPSSLESVSEAPMTRLLPGLESGRINPFAVIADLQEEGAVGSSNCLCPDAATPHCLTVRESASTTID